MIFDFNASDFTPSMGGFEPIPAGDYKAVLAKAEERQNKDGIGRRIALSFQVIEGQYKGRMVPDNLNHKHQDPDVVYRANCRLSALCHAVGKKQLHSIMDLINIPLVITVTRKEIRDMRADPTRSQPPKVVNEIVDYKKAVPPTGENPPQKPAPGSPGPSAWEV